MVEYRKTKQLDNKVGMAAALFVNDEKMLTEDWMQGANRAEQWAGIRKRIAEQVEYAADYREIAAAGEEIHEAIKKMAGGWCGEWQAVGVAKKSVTSVLATVAGFEERHDNLWHLYLEASAFKCSTILDGRCRAIRHDVGKAIRHLTRQVYATAEASTMTGDADFGPVAAAIAALDPLAVLRAVYEKASPDSATGRAKRLAVEKLCEKRGLNLTPPT
jgi:hypothetical protein